MNITANFSNMPTQTIPIQICREKCLNECKAFIFENLINNYVFLVIIASFLFMLCILYISFKDMIKAKFVQFQIYEEFYDTFVYYVMVIAEFLLIVFFWLMKNGIRITDIIKF